MISGSSERVKHLDEVTLMATTMAKRANLRPWAHAWAWAFDNALGWSHLRHPDRDIDSLHVPLSVVVGALESELAIAALQFISFAYSFSG